MRTVLRDISSNSREQTYYKKISVRKNIKCNIYVMFLMNVRFKVKKKKIAYYFADS